MTDQPIPWDSFTIIKAILVADGEWVEFYVQEPPVNIWTDRYARNRANILRIYVRRRGFPVQITAQRQKDGLIHCWGRWNERSDQSPPPNAIGREASSAS